MTERALYELRLDFDNEAFTPQQLESILASALLKLRVQKIRICELPAYKEELPPVWKEDPFGDIIPVCPACAGEEFRNVSEIEDMRSLEKVRWRGNDEHGTTDHGPDTPATWVFSEYPEYTDADAGWIECVNCFQRIEWPLPPQEVVWGDWSE